jgi:hypothetical protein
MSEGTLLLMLTFPCPWPCWARTKLVEREGVAIFAEPGGSLTVRISSGGQVVEFQSCRLVFDAPNINKRGRILEIARLRPHDRRADDRTFG